MNKSHIAKKEINVTCIHTQIEKIKIEIESLEDIKEQKLEDLALFESKELQYDTMIFTLDDYLLIFQPYLFKFI